MSEPFLPFAKPSIGEDEIEEVVDSLRSGWITTGPKVARFEQEFAETVGSKHALAVSSATAGLHLALEAVGVGEGDVVLTTPYTFTATAEVIRYLGADPVFVDIDKTTLNIQVKAAAAMLDASAELRERCRAILPVHFAGLPCDMAAMSKVANDFGLNVVEDAAHAFPARCREGWVGSIGDATVFSFYATKTIATGEGGMLVTDSDEIAKRAKIMRLHGIDRDVWDRYAASKAAWFYEVVAPGYKYNMTDIAASMGIHQLRKAEMFRRRREWIARRYGEAFSGLPLQLPDNPGDDIVHAWHLYVIQLDTSSLTIDRHRFIELMADAGIGTSVHFIPLHIQPYWRERYGFQADSFPNAYNVYTRAVSLPIYPDMDDHDVDRVVGAVTRILNEHQK